MAQIISIQDLEVVINEVRRVMPPVNGVLGPELHIFAEVYGTMIYNQSRFIDIDELAAEVRLTVRKWLPEDKATVNANGTANTWPKKW